MSMEARFKKFDGGLNAYVIVDSINGGLHLLSYKGESLAVLQLSSVPRISLQALNQLSVLQAAFAPAYLTQYKIQASSFVYTLVTYNTVIAVSTMTATFTEDMSTYLYAAGSTHDQFFRKINYDYTAYGAGGA